MGLVNDGQGTIEEMANPRIGTAILRWRPLSPVKDKDGAPGALAPGWNKGLSAWAWRPWIEITAKEWSNDEKPPFSWYVATRTIRYGCPKAWVFADPANVGTTLILFVAPHVAVITRDITVPSGFVAPEVQIVRLDSAAEVPEPGESADLGQMMGERPVDEYFDGMPRGDSWREPPKREPGKFDQRGYLAMDIIRHPTGIVLTKRWEDWRIKIDLSPVMPSFFRIELVETRTVRWRDTSYAFHRFRIYHGNYTRVTFELDSFAYYADSPTAVPATASVELIEVPFDTRAGKRPLMGPIGGQPASTATDDAILWDNYHAITGVPKGGFPGQLKPVKPKPELFENARYRIMNLFATSAIGFIPVVGQLYDVADCISIAMTGKDLWGARRTKGDILMIAAFGVLGGIGDLARGAKTLSAQDIGTLNAVGQKLFPDSIPISTNPGLTLAFARASFNASNAALRRAAAIMAEGGGAKRKLSEMLDLMNSGSRVEIEKFGEEFADELYRVMRQQADALPFEEQPQILQIVLEEGRDLLKVAVIERRPKATRAKIIALFEAAETSQDARGLLAELRGIDATAADLMQDLLLEKVRRRLHSHPTIRRRHAAYVTRYGEIDIAEYIAKKATGSALEFVELIYGTATLELLKGKRKLKPPADILRDNPGYVPKIKELLNDANSYWRHRAQIEERYPGMGRILNSDHILEKRFRKMAPEPEMIDHDGFTALLVPADREVAKILQDNGIDIGWYVHVDKTRWMNELLPQGREGELRMENIAAAYQYFWVHRMGADHATFKALIEDDLKMLGTEVYKLLGPKAIAGGADPAAHVASRISGWLYPRSESALRLEIDLFRKRLGLSKLAETTIGQAVTKAPGL